MSTSEHPYAVIGATGNQGSHVVDVLLRAGAPVRAVLRDPSSQAAQALAARGVEVVAGDQEQPETLRSALTDVAGLFFMTTFQGPDGTEGETRRGVAVAEAAAAAEVPRIVYSSVGGADRHTEIPHFESKRRVEERLEQLAGERSTFVRPTFFMENLADQLPSSTSEETVMRFPMPGDVPLQMVAVRDIGEVSGRILLGTDPRPAGAVEIAGDELTLDAVAERVGARFEEASLDVLGDADDLRAMFRWLAAPPAYRADLAETRRLAPDVLDLDAWLAQTVTKR